MIEQEKIRVIIVDDHEVYRDGLRLLMGRDPLIEIVGEASNGRILLELPGLVRADVILMDIRMPVMDGVQAMREIRATYPGIACIALSTFDNEHLIVEALEAGARGYIIKNARIGEILEAIRAVHAGQPYYCQSTSGHLARMIAVSSFNPYAHKEKERFSKKDIEIIRLICEEKSSKQIGEELFMSTRTVEGIRAKILEKMNVKTSAGIAIYAIKHAIYPIDPQNPANGKP